MPAGTIVANSRFAPALEMIGARMARTRRGNTSTRLPRRIVGCDGRVAAVRLRKQCPSRISRRDVTLESLVGRDSIGTDRRMVARRGVGFHQASVGGAHRRHRADSITTAGGTIADRWPAWTGNDPRRSSGARRDASSRQSWPRAARGHRTPRRPRRHGGPDHDRVRRAHPIVHAHRRPVPHRPRSTIVGGDVTGCSIGPVCKIRGEISSSIVLGYSNKGHEGFVGHSYLGRWVNLGAGTTTSNLKNTYGPVALWTPRAFARPGCNSSERCSAIT